MVVVSSKKTKQKKTLDSWRLFERLQKKLNTSHTWTTTPPTSCIVALDTLSPLSFFVDLINFVLTNKEIYNIVAIMQLTKFEMLHFNENLMM
jgi:hypothetical protein